MLIAEKYRVLERRVGKKMTNYPIGDFLIKIKNAALARKKDVSVQYSGFIYSVSMILKKEKYLNEVKRSENTISIKLAYAKKEPILVGLKLVSKPGKRVYMDANELKDHKGFSLLVVSTPQGVMTSREAVKKNLGGEVIAEIY